MKQHNTHSMKFKCFELYNSPLFPCRFSVWFTFCSFYFVFFKCAFWGVSFDLFTLQFSLQWFHVPVASTLSSLFLFFFSFCSTTENRLPTLKSTLWSFLILQWFPLENANVLKANKIFGCSSQQSIYDKLMLYIKNVQLLSI